MSTSDSQRVPRGTAIASRQFSLLLESGRVWILMALCTMPMLFAQLARIVRPNLIDPYPGYTLVDIIPGLLLVAALWPLLVWRGETWGKRDYHWSLPVNRPAHDLWRVVAGAAWLMICVATSAALAFFLIMHVQGGAPVHLPNGDHIHFYPDAPFWASFFAGPLIVYTFTSILPLCLRRAMQWMVYTVAMLAAFGVVASFTHLSLARTLHDFLNHPYGINVTLTAQTLSRWFHFLADAGLYLPAVVSDFRWPDSPPVTLGNWAIAVAIWLTAGVSGVLLAARRRQ